MRERGDRAKYTSLILFKSLMKHSSKRFCLLLDWNLFINKNSIIEKCMQQGQAWPMDTNIAISILIFKLHSSNSMYSESQKFTIQKVHGVRCFWVETDMHQPKVEIVLFRRATRCGLAKNCSKKPKLIVK